MTTAVPQRWTRHPIVFREARMVDHLPEDMKPLDDAVTRLLEDHRAVGKVVIEYTVTAEPELDWKPWRPELSHS